MNAIGMFVQSIPTEVETQLVKRPLKTGQEVPQFSVFLQQLGNKLMSDSQVNELMSVSQVKELMSESQVTELISASQESESELVNDSHLIELIGTDKHLLESWNDQMRSLLEVKKSSITADNDLLIETDPGTWLIPEMQRVTDLKVDPNLPINQVLEINLDSQDVLIQFDNDDIANLHEQLAAIFTAVEVLLSEVNDKQDIRKIAPKILEYLKQWTALENQLVKTNGVQENAVGATSIKVKPVWQDLLVAYQTRNKMSVKNHYQSDSQVSMKDVVKWLENAFQNQQIVDKAEPIQHMNFQSNMAMPKLEQYVIFVNQNQSSQAMEGQLVEQFQQVMKTSKFLTMPNGVNQLSIALRPENLGEMMVRLTEVNGEMTVKIVVSTQAAKEMLESNINQLRHMFSPQQVVIERQDLGTGQGQNQSKQGDEQSLQNQNENQGHSNESNHQDQGKNETDFEAHLDELIQHVKV